MLTGDDLHPSLAEPVIGTMTFLNEVMSRFPDAISFAPGAPNLAHLDDFDPAACIERYLDHLVSVRGVDPTRARRMLYEYGPSRGLINDLVAGALAADFGIPAAAEDVVVTVGAQEAMLLTLRTLFRPERDVLAVVAPSYVGVLGAARVLDIEVAPVHEHPTGVDLDQLARLCARVRRDGRRVRALYCAPDFANPSGNLYSRQARTTLLALAEREDLLLVEDSTYGFTGDGDHRVPALKALPGGERVIHIGTFAKICLPGARVGYVVADQKVRDPDGTSRPLADEIALVKSMTTVNTSPVCQAVVAGMLLAHGGSLARLGQDRAEVYRRNLRHLLAALDRHMSAAPGVTWQRPVGGLFVRVRVPFAADARALQESAARFGVLWTPMASFHLDGGGQHEIRLSCSYLTPDDIDRGVRRLADFIGSYSERTSNREQ